jgi:signal transduction histidine kinase
LGLKYRINRLKHSLSPQQRIELEAIRQQTEELLNDSRQVCNQLRPPALDVTGLVASIQTFVFLKSQSSPHSIRFEHNLALQEDIPENHAICLYRVLQEAILNIEKHAKAVSVQILLNKTDQGLSLIIQDDGVGFCPPAQFGILVKDNHFGLAGMQEMLLYYQGELTVHSMPGAGCTLTAFIPGEVHDD